MTLNSSETVTSSSGAVTEEEVGAIAFVVKLNEAAKAGRRLFEAMEASDLIAAISAMREARAAYAALDELQKRATR